MKNYIFIIFLIITTSIFAQDVNDKKIYLDSLWKEIPEGNHKYYRIIKDYFKEQESYKVYDYYNSNVLQMEGVYKDKELTFQNGQFTYYYENGNKKTEGKIENAKNIGAFSQWYENGTKKVEGEYFENKQNLQNDLKIINFWNNQNKQLVTNGIGLVTDVSEDEITKGEIKDGLKNGVWASANSKTKISYIENYENGKFISGITTDAENIKHKYEVIEKRPEPKNGYQHFYKFVSKKLKLPKTNQADKGRVILEFIIEKDGSITDIKVIKSFLTEYDNAAIDVLDKYKDWIPGQLRGISVRVRFSIPIVFDVKL